MATHVRHEYGSCGASSHRQSSKPTTTWAARLRSRCEANRHTEIAKGWKAAGCHTKLEALRTRGREFRRSRLRTPAHRVEQDAAQSRALARACGLNFCVTCAPLSASTAKHVMPLAKSWVNGHEDLRAVVERSALLIQSLELLHSNKRSSGMSVCLNWTQYTIKKSSQVDRSRLHACGVQMCHCQILLPAS
eukprot:SAG11_NODE_2709_length_3060_cov_2.574806_4_plen_191_part_00